MGPALSDNLSQIICFLVSDKVQEVNQERNEGVFLEVGRLFEEVYFIGFRVGRRIPVGKQPNFREGTVIFNPIPNIRNSVVPLKEVKTLSRTVKRRTGIAYIDFKGILEDPFFGRFLPSEIIMRKC